MLLTELIEALMDVRSSAQQKKDLQKLLAVVMQQFTHDLRSTIHITQESLDAASKFLRDSEQVGIVTRAHKDGLELRLFTSGEKEAEAWQEHYSGSKSCEGEIVCPLCNQKQ